jgi:hypothetical protein
MYNIKKENDTIVSKSVLPSKIQSAEAIDWKKRAEKIYQQDLASAKAKLEQNQPPIPTVQDNSAIPSYHIVAQDYYIGFHPMYGVIVTQTYNGVQVPIKLMGRKRTSIYQDINNPDYNNLSKAEFDAILKAKPSFALLQSAYNTTAMQNTFDNIINRMSLLTATVVF